MNGQRRGTNQTFTIGGVYLLIKISMVSCPFLNFVSRNRVGWRFLYSDFFRQIGSQFPDKSAVLYEREVAYSLQWDWKSFKGIFWKTNPREFLKVVQIFQQVVNMSFNVFCSKFAHLEAERSKTKPSDSEYSKIVTNRFKKAVMNNTEVEIVKLFVDTHEPFSWVLMNERNFLVILHTMTTRQMISQPQVETLNQKLTNQNSSVK